jgi:hypothetical protein
MMAADPANIPRQLSNPRPRRRSGDAGSCLSLRVSSPHRHGSRSESPCLHLPEVEARPVSASWSSGGASSPEVPPHGRRPFAQWGRSRRSLVTRRERAGHSRSTRRTSGTRRPEGSSWRTRA